MILSYCIILTKYYEKNKSTSCYFHLENSRPTIDNQNKRTLLIQNSLMHGTNDELLRSNICVFISHKAPGYLHVSALSVSEIDMIGMRAFHAIT